MNIRKRGVIDPAHRGLPVGERKQRRHIRQIRAPIQRRGLSRRRLHFAAMQRQRLTRLAPILSQSIRVLHRQFRICIYHLCLLCVLPVGDSHAPVKQKRVQTQ